MSTLCHQHQRPWRHYSAGLHCSAATNTRIIPHNPAGANKSEGRGVGVDSRCGGERAREMRKKWRKTLTIIDCSSVTHQVLNSMCYSSAVHQRFICYSSANHYSSSSRSIHHLFISFSLVNHQPFISYALVIHDQTIIISSAMHQLVIINSSAFHQPS